TNKPGAKATTTTPVYHGGSRAYRPSRAGSSSGDTFLDELTGRDQQLPSDPYRSNVGYGRSSPAGTTIQQMSLPSDMPAFNRSVVENFRANGGEITMEGMLKGADLVLLTTVGRRSGRQHIVPLAYLTDGDDRIVLWASNMAAAEHPAWYRNLAANPQVIVE